MKKVRLRIISIFFAAIIITASLSVLAGNFTVTSDGSYSYADNTDGTVTITRFTPLSDKIKDVTIPPSIDGKMVSTIGEGAFSWRDSLNTVTIPGSVTSIGENAFYFCRSLVTITIPESVSSIGTFAFRYCDLLKEVIFKGTKSPTFGSQCFDHIQLVSISTIVPDGCIGKEVGQYNLTKYPFDSDLTLEKGKTVTANPSFATAKS